MKKHAYLIMAHDDKIMLLNLLSQIDDRRNDIYIHLDKSFYNEEVKKELECSVNNSKIYFVNSHFLNWGTFSIVMAEIELLKCSTLMNSYQYYHLVSGRDLILWNQDDIHDFFDLNHGKEFIDCRTNLSDIFLDRVKYYYIVQDYLKNRHLITRFLNKLSLVFQKIIRINRLKNIKYGFGSQWFSITDEFARYVVSKEIFIKENFRWTLCPDELFIQTLWLNSPSYKASLTYQNESQSNNTLEPFCKNSMRAIDFKRGSGMSPYIFRHNDFQLLLNSNCIFARKFDSKLSKDLIDDIMKATVEH